MKKNQKGFHVIEFSIVIVIIIAIGFIGYRVIGRTSTTSSTSTKSNVSVKPVSQDSIKTKADLKKAADTLKTVKDQSSIITRDLSKLTKAASN